MTCKKKLHKEFGHRSFSVINGKGDADNQLIASVCKSLVEGQRVRYTAVKKLFASELYGLTAGYGHCAAGFEQGIIILFQIILCEVTGLCGFCKSCDAVKLLFGILYCLVIKRVLSRTVGYFGINIIKIYKHSLFYLKELFGIENFANPSIEADYTYLLSYTYLNEEDIYIVTAKEENSIVDQNQFIDYSVIETKTKKDKLITTVAIAYAYYDGKASQYATDMYGENIVAEEASKFPTEKIDEFTKYEFTFTKSKDGKSYVFESIKKVK